MNRRSCRLLLLTLFVVLDVRAAEPAAGKLFMWRVKSATATAYLLGSLHVAKPEMYPLDPQIENAFRDSHALVVEADASPEKAAGMALQMLMSASYPKGDSLDKHISPSTLAALLAKTSLPEAQVKMLKPWFVAMTLTLVELQKLGIDPQYGVDLHFLEKAKGKPVIELESAASQIELFDGFGDKEQEEFLQYTLKENENIGKHINEIIAAWQAGDAKRIEDFLLQSLKDSPETKPLYVKLFDERNAQMARKITELLKTDKTYFIVVGAGHLVGETGLLAQLGKVQKVEQVPASFTR